MTNNHKQHLETFENPQLDIDYTIRMTIPEFTCLCPLTGQPDFAELSIEYVPDKLCVELKALKLYVTSFRDKGAFHEAITNEILSDIASLLKPRFIRITADFNVRGGIYTQVIAEHRHPDWQSQPPVVLPNSL
jgi:7-cyano-7-deazaguanine reductase